MTHSSAVRGRGPMIRLGRIRFSLRIKVAGTKPLFSIGQTFVRTMRCSQKAISVNRSLLFQLLVVPIFSKLQLYHDQATTSHTLVVFGDRVVVASAIKWFKISLITVAKKRKMKSDKLFYLLFQS